jgi:hypothetical protein
VVVKTIIAPTLQTKWQGARQAFEAMEAIWPGSASGLVGSRNRTGDRHDIRWDKPLLPNGRNGSNFLSLVLMTTRPERFRIRALECHLAAQKEKDPKTREAYLELMRNWRELADEIERFEHAWLDREGM